MFSQDNISAECKPDLEPIGNGYAINAALKQRAMYVRLANIARINGDQPAYNAARAKVLSMDYEIKKLDIEKAILDLNMFKNTIRISRIWSNYSGRDVAIVLMPNCKYNIIISGNIYKEEIGAHAIIVKFRQITQ